MDEITIADDGVVSVDGIILKRVPTYVSMYVSEDGLHVWRLDKDGKYRRVRSRETPTTKGTYICVSAITVDGGHSTSGVHRLVCLAWNGLPPSDGKVYEPNHIDGDKHNNHRLNLEWMTRSENVQHAYDTGLSTNGLRITVKDVVTGEIKIFHTLSAFARVVGISRWESRDIISNHRKNPWKGQYLFELDDTSDRKVSRHQRTPIVFKDYTTGMVGVCDSYTQAAEKTGVHVKRLFHQVKKHRGRLFSGCVFYRVEGKMEPFPEFSEIEIQASLEEYPRLIANTTLS
jgi:hypothetical protein